MTRQEPILTTTGQEVYDRRYKRNEETSGEMFWRVAKHVASAEEKSTRTSWATKFYSMMSNLEFLPNSPTLFNAGTNEGVLSACFVLVVEDSLDSIMECHRLSGKIQKFGGGVGYYLGRVRAAGELVKSVHGKACGPVSLLDYYNALSTLITQGGRRAGAQMGILPVDHPDINSFIKAKNDNPDSLSTFNISVSLTDKFMEDYESGDEYAKEKMKLIAESAWKTGDPGVFFVDTANKRNPTPWLGNLEGTNPCGEAPLYHAEACNLGSINLTKFLNTEYTDFDWDRLSSIVTLAIRFLDNVIAVNNYPDEVITEAVLRTRKIGLGVMGWADALALLGINYDSEAALLLADKLMEYISVDTNNASASLGEERGHLADFPFRNATRTSIAPTGTIAILAGCSSGIEPHYKLSYTRTMFDRGEEVKLPVVEPILEHLKAIGSEFIPTTSYDISPIYHIRHQAAFQRHTDLAVSKTINVPEDTSIENIEAAFIELWKQRCVGGTVYRDKSRDTQILSDGDKEPKGITSRERLPSTFPMLGHHFKVGDQRGYLKVGLYADGRPGCIFVDISKSGSTVSGTWDTIAVLTSLALQYNIPLETLSSKLIGMRFDPYGMTDNPEIPNATSLADYIFRWLRLQFGDGQKLIVASGLFCPDCTSKLIYEEGCLKCENKSCGFSKC